MGHVVARMAEALQTRRSRVRFLLVSQDFFIDLMALGSAKPLKH
jgi:hypothetical protein